VPGLVLWNKRDPMLKERPFGLTGAEANPARSIADVIQTLVDPGRQL